MKVTVNMSDDISYLNMGCSIYEGCSNIQIEKMLLGNVIVLLKFSCFVTKIVLN